MLDHTATGTLDIGSEIQVSQFDTFGFSCSPRGAVGVGVDIVFITDSGHV